MMSRGFFHGRAREREREKGKKGSREEMRAGERETELRGTR